MDGQPSQRGFPWYQGNRVGREFPYDGVGLSPSYREAPEQRRFLEYKGSLAAMGALRTTVQEDHRRTESSYGGTTVHRSEGTYGEET